MALVRLRFRAREAPGERETASGTTCPCSLALARYTNFFTFLCSRGGPIMVDTLLIDLKALLVEREDCDAGTVQRVRDGLAQGKTQFRTLRDINDTLKKRLEGASGIPAKKLHLKLGIANYFLGHLAVAIENLRQAEG